jgi:glutamyl-tRNA(Gln) amidotransferase subunit D
LSASSSGGYRGAGLALLAGKKISVGDKVVIKTDSGELSGVIMPRYETASDEYISIKLNSGYNTGVKISKIKSISRLASEEPDVPAKPVVTTVPEKGNLPRVALISTGGTIASKIDYRTGGVRAALSAEELYASVPELAQLARVDPEVLMSEYSENLRPSHWTLVARKVAEKLAAGTYSGIVISHGTDTMHYTAAALSFALQDLPIPVVLVGAQRSSDRPSSDAALNLVGAVSFAAHANVAGVFVAMHSSTSDESVAVHVGTRVRKNHTSRRDAFESIDSTPIAIVKDGKLEVRPSQFQLASRRKGGEVNLRPDFDERVLLLKYHPGLDFRLVEHAITSGYRSVVIEGTGLGHVNKDSFPFLRKAVDEGLMIAMTSQCIWGRVRMTVYDTGRDLLGIGVIPLSDMISETATVKAMWALANSSTVEEAKALMQKNIANEMSDWIPVDASEDE